MFYIYFRKDRLLFESEFYLGKTSSDTSKYYDSEDPCFFMSSSHCFLSNFSSCELMMDRDRKSQEDDFKIAMSRTVEISKSLCITIVDEIVRLMSVVKLDKVINIQQGDLKF